LLMFVWKNINLFKPIIICGAILYVAVNFINIDNIITVNNIRISKNLGKIDYEYLTELSFDNYWTMTKAHKEGLISNYIYEKWVSDNKRVQKHWYQYNYYYNKGNSNKKIIFN
ncbi:membrane protein, partial [Clostridium novyi A str. 4552]